MAEVTGLEALLLASYGVRTAPRENRVTTDVGTSAVKVVNSDPNRVGLLIVNTGVTTLFVAPSNQPSSTKGFILSGGGGNFTMRWDIDFSLVGHEFYAISSAAGGKIYVLENLIYKG